ncbi:MAG TPA: M48 family metalloprotease [Solirubrobacteraceae bacterium]|jgi:STE24 endopeptidase
MSGRWAAAAGPARWARLAAVAVLALAWAWAAHALWRSTVPTSLPAPRIDPSTLFGASYLRRSASYEEFLDIDQLLGQLTLLAVLAVYAIRGHRLMRESAAGRIGTGMLLGMLGFAIVWIAQIPFGLAAVWWERRHGVSHQGYIASVVEGFVGLGGRFVFICFALLVAMGLAGLLRRWWWIVAAPLFAGLALLSTYLSIYLVPNTQPLRDPQTRAELRTLASREGLHHIHAVVQNVSRFTTAPNAESVGFGATRRVILWNTLLDGRFDSHEVEVVIGHELGHLAHNHPLKRVGWLLLFLLPAAGIVAVFTRRRGGLGRPEAVPIALLVFVLLQFLASPLMNEVYRREEAEADWSALRATHDPSAARSLFVKLARTSLADPDPPTWSFLLYDDHPTIVQRIAMVDAWQQRAAQNG